MPRSSQYNADYFAKIFSGANIPTTILSVMILLVPALGVPTILMVQDTLKSMIVAVATLVCALIFFWQQRQLTRPLQWHSIIWLPIALMLYALGSMLWSHTYLAGSEAIRWFIFSLLLWLGLNSFTAKNIPLLIWAIHGGAVLACLWAALQFWFDLTLFPQFAFPSSTFINRNFFAEYIACTLPFSLWALISMRESRWLAPTSLSIAFNLVALMMTGCRSGMLATLLCAPVMLVILWRYRAQFACFSWKKSQQILVVVAFIGGVLALGSIPSGKIGKGATALEIGMTRTGSVTTNTAYEQGSSFSIRMQMWRSTLDMIKAHPLTGIGAGAWEVQIPLYQPSEHMSELDYFSHNEYLQLLSEYGLIIGGLFLTALILYLLITFYKTWQLRGADSQEAPLRAFTLTSLLALCTVSGVGFPWHLAGTSAMFALCLGLLAGSDLRLRNTPTAAATPAPWRPLFSKIAVMFFLCALLLAGYICRQAAVVEYKIMKALQLSEMALGLRRAGQTPSTAQQAIIIENMHQALAITPHYRKLVDAVIAHLITSNDWRNALWLSESLAASRPYVPMLWFRIANLHNKLGEYDQALRAIKIALDLRSVMPGMRALEIDLLSLTGKDTEARQLLNSYLDSGAYDYLLTQSAYKLAIKMSDWPLAIRAMTLRNQIWPAEAAEGYLQMGKVYADTHEETKALEAFRAAIAAATEEKKTSIRSQVPDNYRDRL